MTPGLFEDVQGAFSPLEKVEGLATGSSGEVWIALDNDGGEVESRLIRLPRR